MRRNNPITGLWTLAPCLLAATLWACPATAQDTAVRPAEGPAQRTAQRTAQRPIEESLERYWSSEREMPVIGGNRLFPTERRVEIEVFGGVLPNDAFFTYYPIGLTAGYHFDPTWGAELSATYMGLKSDSELTTFLVDKGAGVRREVDLGDEQIGRVDALATFSPLYGKWSFQTYKISHFDLFFVLGGGVVIVGEPEFANDDSDAAKQVTAVHPEGVFGAGFRFFSLDWLAVRLDARWFFYPAFDDGVAAPAEITLGVSFFTPEI